MLKTIDSMEETNGIFTSYVLLSRSVQVSDLSVNVKSWTHTFVLLMNTWGTNNIHVYQLTTQYYILTLVYIYKGLVFKQYNIHKDGKWLRIRVKVSDKGHFLSQALQAGWRWGVKVCTTDSRMSDALHTHSVKVWEPAHGWAWGRSRVNLLRNDGEHDVLIAPSYHCPKSLVFLDGRADIAGWCDPLTVDADYDIALFQTAPAKQNCHWWRFMLFLTRANSFG